MESFSGIRPASDVPVAWTARDEESLISQRVRTRIPVCVDQDVEAFCSRGDDSTVVIGVSLSVSLALKMNEMVLPLRRGDEDEEDEKNEEGDGRQGQRF